MVTYEVQTAISSQPFVSPHPLFHLTLCFTLCFISPSSNPFISLQRIRDIRPLQSPTAMASASPFPRQRRHAGSLLRRPPRSSACACGAESQDSSRILQGNLRLSRSEAALVQSSR
eukprot:998653-Amorphochlora_amoeboformis.AAC.1